MIRKIDHAFAPMTTGTVERGRVRPRIRLALTVLALSLGLSEMKPLLASAPNAPPNVVVVLADQWRAQAFGFAGDPNVKTPNFDRLAAESARFINAVSGLPVCSPTRASLLTGLRPLTHGVFLNDVQLTTNAVTIAKVLKAQGLRYGHDWEMAYRRTGTLELHSGGATSGI